MEVGHWSHVTLYMARLIGTVGVLVLCIAGRDALDQYRILGSFAQSMVMTVGNCRITTPFSQTNLVDGQRRVINEEYLHCPPKLLHSLGLKAALQCANKRGLARLSDVGQVTAGRVFELRQVGDWSTLKQKAKLSKRQLQALKAHYVISAAAISCPS